MMNHEVKFYFQDAERQIAWKDGNRLTSDKHRFQLPKLAAVRECEICLIEAGRPVQEFKIDIDMAADNAMQ